MNVAVKPMKER